jgi:gliding motility-associated-like protein
LIIKIQLLQAVTAGPDQNICSQDNATLAGQITISGGGIWTTSGTGTFSPSASQLNATYVPSTQDIKNGSVVLTLTANGAGTCYIPTDKLTVIFTPPPTVSAGPTRYVLKGQTITLEPTVSDPGVTYSWSPNIDISSTTVKNPVVTGNVDEIYTLTVTDSRGCSATSSVKVIVSPTIVIPNAFTPNGDGVNDQWNIVGLQAYQQCTVDIYDRNGQKVFHSVGYGVPWDGTYAGKQVPYGAYYYIINPNFSGLHVLSGNVTVIR